MTASTMDELLILHGPPGVGPVVEGEALVSHHGFSARYDVDRDRGVFSREAHDLYGRSLVGKILVCTTAKGGIATSWMLLDMVRRSTAVRPPSGPSCPQERGPREIQLVYFLACPSLLLTPIRERVSLPRLVATLQ